MKGTRDIVPATSCLNTSITFLFLIKVCISVVGFLILLISLRQLSCLYGGKAPWCDCMVGCPYHYCVRHNLICYVVPPWPQPNKLMLDANLRLLLGEWARVTLACGSQNDALVAASGEYFLLCNMSCLPDTGFWVHHDKFYYLLYYMWMLGSNWLHHKCGWVFPQNGKWIRTEET